jgi:hypothetical protein
MAPPTTPAAVPIPAAHLPAVLIPAPNLEPSPSALFSVLEILSSALDESTSMVPNSLKISITITPFRC